MRLLIVLGLALVTACAPATATSAGAIRAEEEPTFLVSDGGVLRPIKNGGRVAIPDGWATVTFSPLPLQRSDLNLDVGLADAAGRPIDAAVEVTYEMLDMSHGVYAARATAHQGRYRMPVQVVMPGRWRFTLTIDRGGRPTTVVIVGADIG
jgi:hypothetical protein